MKMQTVFTWFLIAFLTLMCPAVILAGGKEEPKPPAEEAKPKAPAATVEKAVSRYSESPDLAPWVVAGPLPPGRAALPRHRQRRAQQDPAHQRRRALLRLRGRPDLRPLPGRRRGRGPRAPSQRDLPRGRQETTRDEENYQPVVRKVQNNIGRKSGKRKNPLSIEATE